MTRTPHDALVLFFRNTFWQVNRKKTNENSVFQIFPKNPNTVSTNNEMTVKLSLKLLWRRGKAYQKLGRREDALHRINQGFSNLLVSQRGISV